MYKTLIFSIIGRTLVIFAVLLFVLGVVYITQNTKYLWLLLLLPICEFVPVYEIKHRSNDDGKD